MMLFIYIYINIGYMEYNDQVKELLESYHDKIEKKIMPYLVIEFTNFYSGVAELCGKLRSKGLLKDDPYFKDSEVIELVIPDRSHFTESETQWKVAERIIHFESILSFITHNYNFSLNTFNFNELEKMKQFLDYYNWKGLLTTSTTDLNTQTFGKIIVSYRNSSSDSLILSTFDKCIERIIKSVDSILNKLKFILLYLKESYKLFIREDLLPIVIDKDPEADESLILGLISSEIKNNYSYLKLYKKYIIEVVKEEFSSEGDNLKNTVLKRLTITEKKEIKEKKVKKDSGKDLMILFLEIGKIRSHISASIEKIYLNHLSLIGKQGSFISVFFRNITRILFNNNPKTIYELKIKNNSGGSKNMPLNFEKFYEDIKKLEYDLLNFSEEDRTIIFIDNHNANINHFIDKLLMTIKKQMAIFIALDEHLKCELRKINMKAKGIKPELTVIKTLINSSTSLYRDYLGKVDNK